MTIFGLEWRRERKSLFLWVIVLLIALGSFMAFFPYLSKQGMDDSLTDMVSALPNNMKVATNLTDAKALLTLPGYFVYCFYYVFIAFCIFACLLGSKSLVKEETDGTIEFLLGQPIQRSTIVGQKLFSNVLMIIVSWVILYGFSILFGFAFEPKGYDISHFINPVTRVFLNGIIAPLLFFFFGFCVSAFLKSTGTAFSFSLMFVFLTLICGVLGETIAKVSWLKYVSPIQMVNPQNMMTSRIRLLLLPPIVLFMILCVLIAFFRYGKKELRAR